MGFFVLTVTFGLIGPLSKKNASNNLRFTSTRIFTDSVPNWLEQLKSI